jgi:glutathione S-transferase
MSLDFYYGSGSPYAWRVWLALEYKEIPYTLHTISFSAGDLKKPDYLKINPRRKVPAVVDEGFSLYESVAIVEFLDEHYATAKKLFPGDAKQRALVRRMVQEADQYYSTAMESLVDQILFTDKDKWNADAIAAGRKKLVKELAGWERSIADEYLAGPNVSAADFTLYPLLALTLRMEKKDPTLNIRAEIGPKLAGWMKRIEGLPYLRKTWPPHWQ